MKKRAFKPIHFYIITVGSIFVAEFAVMLLLSILPSTPPFYEAIIDSLLLTTIVLPLLYLLFLRPTDSYFKERESAEEALQESYGELENRVAERTNELNKTVQVLRAEIAVRKLTEESLKESRKLYRAVLQTSTDAIISADSSGKILAWNRGAKTIFGHKEEEALGRQLTILMPERHRDAHSKGVRQWLRTGESRMLGKITTFHGLRKDGSEFPFDLSLTSWETEKGKYFTGIIRDITERKQMEDELNKLVTTDKLTKAYNRVKFEEIIAVEMERATRHDHPLSMLIIDIDDFKDVNDTSGHLAGDYVLTAVADILHSHMRKITHLIRWGGDEFIILPLETDIEGAKVFSERLRQAIESYDFGMAGKITVSIGIGLFHKDDTEESFLHRADGALYKAKEAGGNRVEASV